MELLQMAAQHSEAQHDAGTQSTAQPGMKHLIR